MSEITITFPDGSKKTYKKGITAEEIVKSIGPRLEKDAIVAKVDSEFQDLNKEITKDSDLKIITFNDSEGKRVFWHSTNHVLAHAVKNLFPEAKLGTELIIPVSPIERYTDKYDDNELLIPELPQQNLTPWMENLERLITDRDYYETQSRCARSKSF